MFLEAMGLYKTVDLKFNPTDSSHFESNFKRTINCPTTRANMSEPINGWLTGVTVAILEWKKSGALRGHEKIRGATCLSWMAIFHCKEDWFAMIKPIKPNIVLWISSEPSLECLRNRLKVCWLKVICCICQSNELNVKLSKKVGGQAGGQPKIWEGPWPTQAPLYNRHCGVIIAVWRTLLDNGEVIMRISHFLLHNITSQGSDNAS